MGRSDHEGVTVVCPLVYRCLQPSHLWLSSNSELGCVWVASVHNYGLTSPAAPHSPAGFGAQATHNVGGSFFSLASLEPSSTELSPEERKTNNNVTKAMRDSDRCQLCRGSHITCCLKYRLSSSSTSTRLRK